MKTRNRADVIATRLLNDPRTPKDVRMVAASCLVKIGVTNRHLNALAMDAMLRRISRQMRQMADDIDGLLNLKKAQAESARSASAKMRGSR